MSSFLAMMLYIDYKCDTQPGFRKVFLVLTLIFVLFLWSPWRPFSSRRVRCISGSCRAGRFCVSA
jgi:hypothetical protein